MKLRRLERKCLCQVPANQNMAIFNNCLCESIAENTMSVKNMISLLQPINIYMNHSCLVDVYSSQNPYRTVMCWLLYFWFISFHPAEGQNQVYLQGGQFPPITSGRESAHHGLHFCGPLHLSLFFFSTPHGLV